MTTRDTPFAAGTPCWVDLLTSDVEASTAFYTGLFGWTAETSGEEFGNYVIYSLDGYPVAGQTPNQPDFGSPDVWSTYIASDDCEATVTAAEAAGAKVMFPTMAVGEVGTMAMLQDPAGAAFGVWQAGQHTGFGRYNEPGTVTWDEHQSKDFAASAAFYGEVFGWEYDAVSDTDDFRYSTAQVDGSTVGGMMDAAAYLPAEVPSHWAVYFSVDSADGASAKVQELGGAVIQAAEDTPYGRIALVADPTGAQFRLHQAPPSSDA
jgi:predicted enzyme related to lactoylglutathione lyase